MTSRQRFTVFDVAEDLCLEVRYTCELPANVFGHLDPGPEPVYIAVNANTPECEQKFTIAHEIGHYLKHHNRTRLKPFNKFLSRSWKSPRMVHACRQARLSFAILFGPERQADLYAMSLLLTLGDTDTLMSYVNRNPHQRKWLLLLELVLMIRIIPRLISLPFGRIRRPMAT